MFPPSLSDLLSPSASLCFISSGTAHTVLVAQTHSNQQGQEASVLVTMPAASSLICRKVPFSKFNLREIQMIIRRLLQRVGLQSRTEPHAVTGSEENQRPPSKLRVCGKNGNSYVYCVNRKQNTFSSFASRLHTAVTWRMKLTEDDVSFAGLVSGWTELEIRM